MPSPDDNETLEVMAVEQGASVGVVMGIVSGVVILVAVVVVVLAVWIRRKRQRDIEFERAKKVQRSSAITAGVYIDLATDTPIVKKPVVFAESSEMEKLRKDDGEEIA
ncbi:uncharacterized protein LOC121374249 isoform X2 [Gigantopelta aegis]|nr:uncharacterized protein LOC121374249 isoform X2 [Gigantopelta aegis]XP_041357204.1 uncharacterized protein LOC121374249 isoform X2 [Gigantopelta aegis]